ncbi:Small subunit (SSU) processome component [Paramarasmius palmivorus]|uniref:Small subunit (SSU) processome component n=1 Tax=Paramarasmius palmivorus TaxID=297713 RepID=A0AAW0BQQ7_9AGAR
MSAPEKSKKNRNKSNKSRPQTTTTISQPAVQDASYLTALSSFSHRGNFFAHLSLAVDKHRLRVFNTATEQSQAEHVVESARVASLSWCQIELTPGQKADDGEAPTKKKRRKSQAAEDSQEKTVEVVALGLTDGSVLLFSPTHGRVYWTLSNTASTASILSIAAAKQGGNLWTSGADGIVRLWNVHKNELLASVKSEDRIPYSALAVRPPAEDSSPELLVANHSIKLWSAAVSGTQKPKEIASFTGHASPVKSLQWDGSQSPPRRFVSMAEGDRVLSLWDIPADANSEGSIVASVQLDSDARAVSFSKSSASDSEKQILLALAASGKIGVYPIPDELLPPASSSRTQHKISTLLPRTTITPPSKGTSSSVPVVAVSFVEDMPRTIRVARIVGGVRPVFDVVQYQDETGNFIAEVTLESVKPSIAAESSSATLNRRYGESSNVAVGSGVEIGQNEEMDAFELQNDNNLDVDLAELTLGQRLTAISGVDALPEDDSEDEDDSSQKKQKGKRTQKDLGVVPAASLTRTLIQALHSSDAKLLETCLAHSDTVLIRNTVRRLPPQLAVPLVTACVERLGRGARGGNLKGGGGGASSQRGTSLITWVKTVLSVHSGHLMTMPDLVARLSGLHATLTSRLTLQESLLSLSGRLDMVLSQIEMRASAPSAYAQRRQANAQKTAKARYVEGESEDEDGQMDVEVEVDSGDEEGSIEDVELGGSSEDETGEEDEEDEEEESDDAEEPTMNGFIDDEAEEEFTDDEDDEESD